MADSEYAIWEMLIRVNAHGTAYPCAFVLSFLKRTDLPFGVNWSRAGWIDLADFFHQTGQSP